MTADEWLASEKFIYITLPILFLITGLVLFVLIFFLLYRFPLKKKMRYLTLFIIVLTGSGLIYAMISGTQSTKEYDHLSRLVTPAMRDRRPKAFRYQYYHYHPAKLLDKPKIEEIGLYDKSEILEEDVITYLGSTRYLYYFKAHDKLYKISRSTKYITFSDEVETPIRKGYSYQLKDMSYASLGFYDTISPLYTEIIFPKEMENLTYEHGGGKTSEYTF